MLNLGTYYYIIRLDNNCNTKYEGTRKNFFFIYILLCKLNLNLCRRDI